MGIFLQNKVGIGKDKPCTKVLHTVPAWLLLLQCLEIHQDLGGLYY